ncbi:MAG: CapA family protein [Spirochaetia bacterium]|nr:CapA family protein [Spirochaetia bacterium]
MKISLKNHKFKKSAYIFFAIIYLCFSGCSNTPIPVSLNISRDSKVNWDIIIESFPLPEGYIFVPGSSENLTIPKVVITIGTAEYFTESEKTLLLERVYLVPVTNFWNPATDIKLNDISEYKRVPIEDIKLPEKGLSIEGLYPGDHNYPLYKNKVLSITFPEELNDKNDDSIDLETWLNSIKNAFDITDTNPPKISWVGGVGDMMLANLEGSITYSNTKTPKSFNFKFDPKVLPVLKEVGFDYFSITNNHIFDYGETGFKDTFKYLKEADIPTSGDGGMAG